MYYYIVLLSNLLESLAYLPAIYLLYETQYTANIPLTTIVMLLCASFLQVMLAISRGYGFYVLLFGIYFASIATILVMKIQNDMSKGLPAI